MEHCKTLQFRNVADFGAAELTLVQYLKNLDFINQITAVDIDRQLLESHKNRCRPLLFDHLNKRNEPLNLSVLCGSVLEFDSRLYDLDCICAIELIEHLQPGDVPKFTCNVFGALLPRHVILTTPNKDFNLLFEFKEDQMRHWDHKFEWTREEFKEYCDGVVSRFNYTYKLVGVGDPPPDQLHVGPCSQGALFTRKSLRLPSTVAWAAYEQADAQDSSEKTQGEQNSTSRPYEVIYSVDYPVKDKSHTPDYHLKNELRYICGRLGQDEYQDTGEDITVISIPHLQTFPSIAQYCASDEHIAELARECPDLQVLDDGLSVLVRNVPLSPESSLSGSTDDIYYEVVREREEVGKCDEEEELW